MKAETEATEITCGELMFSKTDLHTKCMWKALLLPIQYTAPGAFRSQRNRSKNNRKGK